MGKRHQAAEGGGSGTCRDQPEQHSDQPMSNPAGQSRVTSSALASNQTRPLFGSLEEAHSRITRLHPSGEPRNVAVDLRNSDSGDETILGDMRSLSPADARAIFTNVGYPVTRMFGRSVTDATNRAVDEPALVPSPLLVQKHPNTDPQKNSVFTSPTTSKTAPIAWQSPDEPWQSADAQLIEARAFAEANTSNQPPPYSPRRRVDRHGLTAQDSFAAQSNPGPHVLSAVSVDGDRLARKPQGGNEANTKLVRVAEKGIGEPPHIALPEIPPFHPKNPFAVSARLNVTEPVLGVVDASPASETSSPKRPSYCSDSKDDRARIGSDLGVGTGIGVDSGLGVGSDLEAGSDESKLPNLRPPPARMHSVRRQERQERVRQSLISNARSSFGAAATEGSEEDPFQYDSIFLQPSREREVSVDLHQVSGVDRGSTAIICSPDGSPLKTRRDFLGRGDPSPVERRMLLNNQVSPLRLPDRTTAGSDARIKQDQEFFEPGAINPEWTVGSPGVVRVPVRGRDDAYQRQNLQESHPVGGGGFPELVLEGLRGCEEQNRLPTGNTEG
ncbi:hypothetical protein Daus18300_000737 [Diaporthe australafricana]|uniref:Uncharacterized protein n=1 Tax=Diaporthe australafricana TaxID=127596 RepID=A0ABR3Y2X7_9PEZI